MRKKESENGAGNRDQSQGTLTGPQGSAHSKGLKVLLDCVGALCAERGLELLPCAERGQELVTKEKWK